MTVQQIKDKITELYGLRMQCIDIAMADELLDQIYGLKDMLIKKYEKIIGDKHGTTE